MNVRKQAKANHYRKPQSADELTAQNVKAIAELERAAKMRSTTTDRVASAITGFCGSMPFVWVHVVWFGGWIILNSAAPTAHFDPYPFSLLTLVVSLEAIFLSTFIMIAENRQERLAERRSHLDLQINLLAEQEGTKMLRLLEQIAKKHGIDASKDPEFSLLEQATHPEKVAAQIDRTVEDSGKAPDHH